MKKMTPFFKKISLGSGIFIVMVSLSMAAAPLFINYQGKLTDSSGVPIENEVSVSFSFRFYNHPTLSGANLLGSPDPNLVTPENGVFSVPVPVQAEWFSGTDVYLGVSVDGGLEMLPRQKLVSSPFALAVGANSVGFDEIKNDAVIGAKILNGTVGEDDLAGGAVAKGKLKSNDLLDVYKTRGDERLILGANYYSAVCDTTGAPKYFECDGSCGSDTKANSCTNGVMIGRVINLPD